MQPQRQQPPPVTLRAFKGSSDTLATMERLATGQRGEQSFLVRQFAEQLTRYLAPKAYLAEIAALRNVCVQRSPRDPNLPLIRYANDPLHVEFIKDPQRLVEEINAYGSTTADCDEITCLIGAMALCLGREVAWLAMGFQPGSLSHVAALVKEPKSGQWILCDPVAGPDEPLALRKLQNKQLWDLS